MAPPARQPAGPPALVELRLLVGPNLYFPRPAVKLTLDVGALLGLPTGTARELASVLGMGSVRPGDPGSAFRQRFAARWVARLVRRLAAAAGVSRLAVRSRAGSTTSQLVVSYPWRSSGRADALGRGVAAVIDALAAAPDTAAWEQAVAEAGERVRVAPRGRAPDL